MKSLLSALFLGAVSFSQAEPLRVVSLHPLVGDLLKQVGGDKIEVVDLIGENGDPHSFEPATKELAAADGASIYFVSGMGLESYLPKLTTVLAGKASIIEVGKTLPSLEGACQHKHHEHDHDHGLDPHWWHSVDHFRRAVGIVSSELTKAKPEDAAVFETNAKNYRQKLDELEKWVKRELVSIPKEKRKLATAHAAFEYFCEAYGFESYAVQGINREQMPDAAKLAKLISTLKKESVSAIFPEKESNPKIIQSITKDTGIALGGELIADGRGMKSYEEMMRANVSAIVTALSSK